MTQAHALTKEQHRLMEGMAPFELPEEAHLAGKKLAGTRARVYWLLRITAERSICHQIGELVGPAGWVPNYYFRKAWSGGNAGDRRLRDLREKFGVEIESTRFSGDSSTVLFRWVSDGPQAPNAGRTPESSSAHRSETRPLARSGQMNSFSGERGTHGAPDLPATSAGRLRFWTSVGFPGGEAPGRVELLRSLDAHPVSFPQHFVAQIVTGKLGAAEALAAYDRALHRRWPALRAWLEHRGEHVLWLGAEAAAVVDPLPLLVDILTKCGAEYLGDWQHRERQAENTLGVA